MIIKKVEWSFNKKIKAIDSLIEKLNERKWQSRTAYICCTASSLDLISKDDVDNGIISFKKIFPELYKKLDKAIKKYQSEYFIETGVKYNLPVISDIFDYNTRIDLLRNLKAELNEKNREKKVRKVIKKKGT